VEPTTYRLGVGLSSGLAFLGVESWAIRAYKPELVFKTGEVAQDSHRRFMRAYRDGDHMFFRCASVRIPQYPRLEPMGPMNLTKFQSNARFTGANLPARKGI